MFNWFGFRTRQFEEKLNDIPSNIPLRRAALQELADAAVHRVIRRTERGRDYKDKPFKPYSESYLKFRTGKGRRGKTGAERASRGLAVRGNRALVRDRVTLTFRGEMLAALTGSVRRNMARLYFTSALSGRIANYHNSLKPRRKMPLRRFLDFEKGTNDYKELAKLAARLMAEQVERGW